jgi:hypothetical protein
MASPEISLIDAPIPGMSLTAELGGRPWQTPAQYTDVDSAIEYYMSRMTSEEFMDDLIDVLEMGVPVTTLANSIQLSNVMEGKHSVDVGMLVTPLLMELIMMIAESAEIEYDSGLDNPEAKKTRQSVLAKTLAKMEKRVDEAVSDEAPVQEEEEEKPQTGLMARRS